MAKSNIRTLTDNEYALLNLDTIEMVLGQDHEWYIYSNEIDAYCGTGRRGAKYTEEEILKIVKAEGIHREATWNFGDEPEF